MLCDIASVANRARAVEEALTYCLGRVGESMASVGMQLGRVIERKTFQDRLLTLAEDEHRRIGQELHDDVGLQIMRYRAGLIGATLAIESLATGGVRVTCRLPKSTT